MKENYQIITDRIIEEITNSNITPTLLLHSCCAPCSSYVLEYLSKYFKITIIYYNPNIYPEDEYQKRLQEQINLINQVNYPNKVNIINTHYNNKEFNEAIKGLENLGERSPRCHKCYQLRLEETAKEAKLNHYDYFTTTLSLSPYKDSDIINKIGKLLESKYQVKYLYSDFKKKNGYKRSIELSKIYHLYRQNYCGCIYSKQEKDLKDNL